MKAGHDQNNVIKIIYIALLLAYTVLLDFKPSYIDRLPFLFYLYIQRYCLDSDVSVLYCIKQNYPLNHLVLLFSALQKKKILNSLFIKTNS